MTVVRPAHWSDHAQLAPIVDAFAAFHHTLNPAFRPRWLGFTEAIFQTWLDERADFHLVAEHAGRIAGYVWAGRGTGSVANYLFMRRNIFVYVLAVDEAQRRQGIGRALFGAVEEAARAYDAEIIQLSVVAGNERAQAFYRSLGYEADSMFMTKVLRPMTRIEG